jgi:DNA polymerase-3 subunit gamma/tau
VVFVLATTDPQKVPVTVLSRCLQFNLKNMSPGAVAEHLVRVLESEAVPFERDALAHLGRAAAGSMRDALSLLDQAIAFGAGSVSEATVRSMLGAVDQRALTAMVDALARADGPSLIGLADRLREDNAALGRVLDDLAVLFHRLALIKAGLRAEADEMGTGEALAACAAGLSPEQIQVWYQIVIHGARDLPLAPDEFSGFSMVLLRLLAFRAVQAGDADLPPESPSRSRIQVQARGQSRPQAAAQLEASVQPQALAQPEAPARPQSPAQTKAPEQSTAQTHVSPLAESGLQARDQSPAPGAASAPATRVFDGDWAGLARSMSLGGFARQFMDQSELLGVSGDVFHVRVPIKALAEGPASGKVTEALSQRFGRPIRLKIEVGAVTGVTAAGLAEQDRSQRLAQARASIEADPFVQTLVQDFGGSIVAGSVQPADGSDG